MRDKIENALECNDKVHLEGQLKIVSIVVQFIYSQ